MPFGTAVAYSEAMPADLTDRRRDQTRAEIAAAAVELFARQGFDQTTMDEVAQASGVSRRTAYRHFPSKEDLVFEHPRRWLARFSEVTADRAPGESTRDLLRRGILAIPELIEAHRPDVLKAFSVLMATPSLMGRHGRSDAEWRMLCAAIVAEDLGTSPKAILQTSVIVGALVGCTNGLIGAWAATQPDADMPAMTIAALDQIDSIWPASTR